MDNTTTLGGLLPLWLIGAPLVASLILLFTAPKSWKSARRDQRYGRDDRPFDGLQGRQPADAEPLVPVTAVPTPRY